MALRKRTLVICIFAFALTALSCLVIIKTRLDLRPTAESLQTILQDARKLQVLDRHGAPLNVTFQNSWNAHDYIPLHEVPKFLKTSFIVSEDKRFFTHAGVDWRARLHALWINLKRLKIVRGASTITEQAVRMLNPRPRTFWSRWLEGWEAGRMEQAFSKEDIFEFYLNQVPYAANRRGVAQAARYYFGRDLNTLTHKEMLALTVLVRAPSALTLYGNPQGLEPVIARLSKQLVSKKILSDAQARQIYREKIYLEKPLLPIRAPHFARRVLTSEPHHLTDNHFRVRTTLDGELQKKVQALLNHRLKNLQSRKNVHNGAVLVTDHTTGEILAWVVGGSQGTDTPGISFDSVATLRQPGSALKPFLYALALDSGWTADKMIDDTPFSTQVGFGMHRYRNYSRLFYGPVTLREALGNSLNIPAIRTTRYVGSDRYLSSLRRLGFAGLDQRSDYYGDGLALGNGEVTLLELTQAYTTLARQGEFRKLSMLMDDSSDRLPRRVFSSRASSTIADILSDPSARQLEFGGTGVLNFPVQTAVKTGTSSDYRDAWAVAFNYRYTVGSWMGNLDRTPTNGLTGASGPALLLRGIFAELNKGHITRPLRLSPEQKKDPSPSYKVQAGQTMTAVRIIQPTDGLHLAMDPRIPDDKEAFEFLVAGLNKGDSIKWIIDSVPVGGNPDGKYLWSLKKGAHQVRATVMRDKNPVYETSDVAFLVK